MWIDGAEKVYPGPDGSFIWVEGSQWESMSCMGGATNQSPLGVAASQSLTFDGRRTRLCWEHSVADGWLRGMSVDDTGQLCFRLNAGGWSSDQPDHIVQTSLMIPLSQRTKIFHRSRNVASSSAAGYGRFDDGGLRRTEQLRYDTAISPLGFIAFDEDTLLHQEWEPDENGRFRRWNDVAEQDDATYHRYQPPFEFDRIDRWIRCLPSEVEGFGSSNQTLLYYLGDRPVGVYVPHLLIEYGNIVRRYPHTFGRFATEEPVIVEFILVDEHAHVLTIAPLQLHPQTNAAAAESWLGLYFTRWQKLLTPLIEEHLTP